MLNQITQGDCFELMRGVPDRSIDLVLTDPPYNSTALAWDQQPIDLVEFWGQIKRVLKPTGAVVLTAYQPFTSILVTSNPTWFKYPWVWKKTRKSSFLNVKYQPLREHEDILVFAPGRATNGSRPAITFNPQGVIICQPKKKRGKPISGSVRSTTKDFISNLTKFPSTILEFDSVINPDHPTQKPLALFEYLIKTYTNPGATILDPFVGSGTSAHAAFNTGRDFICFEFDLKYWSMAIKRLQLAQMQQRMVI